MEELKRWLDDEIEKLENETSESNQFIWGKHAEAIRIRAMMCQIYANGGGWVPVEKRHPDTDRYVLLSFENFSGLVIGRYEEDEEGGAFYAGDDDVTLVSDGLFVNAWMELPEPYKESEDI